MKPNYKQKIIVTFYSQLCKSITWHTGYDRLNIGQNKQNLQYNKQTKKITILY